MSESGARLSDAVAAASLPVAAATAAAREPEPARGRGGPGGPRALPGHGAPGRVVPNLNRDHDTCRYLRRASGRDPAGPADSESVHCVATGRAY